MDNHDVRPDGHRLNFGVSIHELRALCALRKRNFNKDAELEDVAVYALRFALANPDKLESFLNSLNRYCEAEGLSEASQFENLIASRKEYKHTQTKIGGGK